MVWLLFGPSYLRSKWTVPCIWKSISKPLNKANYLFNCLFTVNVCDWTPPTPHKTRTAPSKTRSARSTSTVKSTWPKMHQVQERKLSLTRSVDNVDVSSMPVNVGSGRLNCNSTLSLQLHKIHCRSNIVLSSDLERRNTNILEKN